MEAKVTLLVNQLTLTQHQVTEKEIRLQEIETTIQDKVIKQCQAFEQQIQQVECFQQLEQQYKQTKAKTHQSSVLHHQDIIEVQSFVLQQIAKLLDINLDPFLSMNPHLDRIEQASRAILQALSESRNKDKSNLELIASLKQQIKTLDANQTTERLKHQEALTMRDEFVKVQQLKLQQLEASCRQKIK